MDLELKKTLERNFKLAKENNHLLKKLNRAHLWSRAFSAIKWLVIIGISLGAYYYIQPFLENLLSIYTGNIPDLSIVQSLLK
ncbi:MAG: hypothetical protein U9R00_03155 [Patescibacteria group bacterium]|nr:hypothetical protein [Patescibacteria group bacterium]